MTDAERDALRDFIITVAKTEAQDAVDKLRAELAAERPSDDAIDKELIEQFRRGIAEELTPQEIEAHAAATARRVLAEKRK